MMLPHCEAVTRPSMVFMSAKSEQPQPGLILHRSRQLLVRQRTMLSNAIRGHMAELVTTSRGRNGTVELLELIANADDDHIPADAQLSLDACPARPWSKFVNSVPRHAHHNALSGGGDNSARTACYGIGA
jgi:hypothetical protein